MKVFSNAPISFSSTPWKVAVVTGLSNPQTCELHHHQVVFLQRLHRRIREAGFEATESSFVWQNFPFVHSDDANDESPGLIQASFANTRQYLLARTSRYARLAAPHWKRLFDSSQRICLIAGSCGLEFIVRALAHTNPRKQVNVLAMGPVANFQLVNELIGRDQLQLRVLCGSRDWVASRKLKASAEQIPQLGHLGYWNHHLVEQVAYEWLRSNISEYRDPEATFPQNA